MRWITKTEQEPNRGDHRVARCFAWRRTQIGDYTIWLEWYEVHERVLTPVGGAPASWCETWRQVT